MCVCVCVCVYCGVNILYYYMPTAHSHATFLGIYSILTVILLN